jgi:23S rRNA (guanosine2251-2'-O)-methyltransferase
MAMRGESRERIFGRNAACEILRAGRRKVYALDVAEGAEVRGSLRRLLDLAEASSIAVNRVRRADLDRESDSHQGVAATAAAYPYVEVGDILKRAAELSEPPLILLLDLIQNPQNLGTLLRTAEAVGVHGVVIGSHRAAGITPAVVSSSSGASEHLRIARGNLAQAMDRLRTAGVWMVGLEAGPEAVSLDEVNLAGALGLVVGNEGEGLRRLVRDSCDVLMRLPMRGRIESLNAAVAGSLALYAAWAARGYAGAGPHGPQVAYIDEPAES